ncbi:MAG: type II toxin-antitoxin system VapC family toxin [Rhizobiaceae bacterium]
MKTSTLVDTNILIDVLGPRDPMSEWSAAALDTCRGLGSLLINTVVWSELAPLASEATLGLATAQLGCEREMIPWNAAYLAGTAHLRYRRSGGTRERTLPDFLIGAHAQVAGHRILTRDAVNYRRYFPDVEIVYPAANP